jgi:hypothetical protein
VIDGVIEVVTVIDGMVKTVIEGVIDIVNSNAKLR